MEIEAWHPRFSNPTQSPTVADRQHHPIAGWNTT